MSGFPFCGGAHLWHECPVVYTPIIDCEHKNIEDGCCSHPKNMTPECHVAACPRLNEKLRADTERLDWLADRENGIGQVLIPREIVERNLASMRAAIDEARRQNVKDEPRDL